MPHKHDEEGMFGHHDARYNAEQIIRNLLLIQDHYAMDPCADCLSKHWNLVLAYISEGRTLDNNEKVIREFNECEPLGNRHLKVITECAVGNVCKVKKPEDMQRMVQEVRSMRRKLNNCIYGLEGDITHDILVEKDDDHHHSTKSYVHDLEEEPSEHGLAL